MCQFRPLILAEKSVCSILRPHLTDTLDACFVRIPLLFPIDGICADKKNVFVAKKSIPSKFGRKFFTYRSNAGNFCPKIYTGSKMGMHMCFFIIWFFLKYGIFLITLLLSTIPFVHNSYKLYYEEKNKASKKNPAYFFFVRHTTLRNCHVQVKWIQVLLTSTISFMLKGFLVLPVLTWIKRKPINFFLYIQHIIIRW